MRTRIWLILRTIQGHVGCPIMATPTPNDCYKVETCLPLGCPQMMLATVIKFVGTSKGTWYEAWCLIPPCLAVTFFSNQALEWSCTTAWYSIVERPDATSCYGHYSCYSNCSYLCSRDYKSFYTLMKENNVYIVILNGYTTVFGCYSAMKVECIWFLTKNIRETCKTLQTCKGTIIKSLHDNLMHNDEVMQ